MLSKEKLARINELAKKKKVQGLSADETNRTAKASRKNIYKLFVEECDTTLKE